MLKGGPLTVNATFLTRLRFTAFLLFAKADFHLALAASIRERQSNTAVCRQFAVSSNSHFPKLKMFQCQLTSDHCCNFPVLEAQSHLYVCGSVRISA